VLAILARRALHGSDIRARFRLGQSKTLQSRGPRCDVSAGSAHSDASDPASDIAPLPRPCMAKAKSASPSYSASVSRTRQIARASKSSDVPP
jgi:hypothetical protein